jgi:hypothetical protein
METQTADKPKRPCSDKQRAHLQNIAQKGGLATLERYGAGFFKAIAPAGFDAYCQKYFNGDKHAAWNSLNGQGKVIGGKRWRNSVKVNRAQFDN